MATLLVVFTYWSWTHVHKQNLVAQKHSTFIIKKEKYIDIMRSLTFLSTSGVPNTSCPFIHQQFLENMWGKVGPFAQQGFCPDWPFEIWLSVQIFIKLLWQQPTQKYKGLHGVTEGKLWQPFCGCLLPAAIILLAVLTILCQNFRCALGLQKVGDPDVDHLNKIGWGEEVRDSWAAVVVRLPGAVAEQEGGTAHSSDPLPYIEIKIPVLRAGKELC